MPDSLFKKVTGLRPAALLKRPAILLKRDSGTGVSCEFFEISKNTVCYRTPPVAASVQEDHFFIFQKQISKFVYNLLRLKIMK